MTSFLCSMGGAAAAAVVAVAAEVVAVARKRTIQCAVATTPYAYG